MHLTVKWHVGHVVIALRDQFGWTQPQLAKKAGMNKATVVSVEAMDRNHGRETYEKIAVAFGLTMAQLFALVPDREKESQQPKADPNKPGAPGAAGTNFPRGKRA